MVRGGRCYSQGKEVRQYIKERDSYTCQLCGEPGGIIDHVNPWRVSHDSTISNLRVLCRPCNLATRRRRKDAKPSLEEWYQGIKQELARA